MANQDIVRYLEEGKKRGFSVQLLKSKLLEAGFAERDIDEAISEISVQPLPSGKLDFLTQPKEQQMPLGEAQQMRQLPGEQKTFDKPESLMQKPSEIKPLQGFQKKEEVGFGNKAIGKLPRGNAEGKWIKIGAILGIVILLMLVFGAVLVFFAQDFLNELAQNNLTLLIISIILVLVNSIYTYAYVRLGKKTEQRVIVLGSWFSIVPWILYLVLVVLAGTMVYEPAVNFFSGTDSEGSYKVMFLVLAILWVVALLLHVIGMILKAIGMMKLELDLKTLRTAGIINAIVFVCGLGFLVGIIVFIYSILNAFSTPGAGYDGVESIMATSTIAAYSLIALLGVKAVALVFEILGLFKASKKYE